MKSCPVIYIALEGQGGVPKRFAAWEQRWNRTIPSTMRVVMDHLSLLEREDVEELARELLAAGASHCVIILDTVNQSALGADENSSQDMGRILSNAQLLQELTQSLVILLHHAGKDPKKGLRGHSSLEAALDAAIEVTRDSSGPRNWSLVKSKDGEDGLKSEFRLGVITLGTDADGFPITSCVVEQSMQQFLAQSRKPPKGPHQKTAIAEITKLIQQSAGSNGSSVKQAKYDDALAAVAAALAIESKRKRERAAEAIAGLVAGGHLGWHGDYLRLS